MSEVSFCVECGKGIPHGNALCKECWEKEQSKDKKDRGEVTESEHLATYVEAERF